MFESIKILKLCSFYENYIRKKESNVLLMKILYTTYFLLPFLFTDMQHTP